MTPLRARLALPLAALMLPLMTVAALCLGRYTMAPGTVLAALVHPLAAAPLVQAVVWDERLPRVLAALLVGAGLSVSGASYQAVFRNPLVSPGILGVLAGAGLGAALAVLLGLSMAGQVGAILLGGVAAVAVSLLIGRLFGQGESLLLLVFGGLVSGALFTALLSLVKFTADPESQLPDIVFWLLGSLANLHPPTLWRLSLPVLAMVLLLVLLARRIDLLVLSDDEAHSMGIAAARLRLVVIVAATAASGLTIALAGSIGWVGLVIPHIARLIVGPGHRRLLPLSALLGAAFMLLADTIARSVTASEIPIGIITDLLGVFAFLLVLPRVRRGWL